MKKLTITSIALATLGISFTTPIFAETPSYDYLQVSATELEDNFAFDLNGYEFKLKKSLTNNIYFSLDTLNVEEGNAEFDFTNIGIGFNSSISNYTSLFAQIDYSQAENSNGFDDSGYRLSIGTKSRWGKKIETKVAYEYTDIEDSTKLWVLEGAYRLNSKFSLVLDIKNGSDFDQTGVGFRYSF